ncbi:MAG: hypothetical protein HOG79_02875, partial [Prolixibacteraceae bacterium]|nr:hypothetical protein [Prolixibacteraceae bacterium]
MKLTKTLFLGIFFSFSIVNVAFSQQDDLKKGFKNPDKQYSMLPFWSWNGTLEKDKLLFQLEQMKEKGIDGAFMHARAGINKGATPYFSEGWWNAVDVTVDFAAKNNFNAYLYDEDKWPSGSAGGRTLKKNRQEFIKKGLEYKKMEIHGPNTLNVNEPENVTGIFVAKFIKEGVIDYESITDITNLNGKVWNVPEGEWVYTSFVQKNHTGEQIDYLDKKAVEAFIEVTHEEYYKRYGEHFGSVIPGVFFDEIRATTRDKNSLVWTDDFLEKFQQIKGYDLRNNLPLLIYNNGTEALKINHDYYDVFTQLYHNAWFKTYHDWCEEHGIWVTGHTEEDYKSYHGQGDYLKTMGQLQVPGTDNEYFRYGYPRVINWVKPKQISSIAHIYGRNRVMVEAMGGSGYVIPLEEYRYGFAMFGAFGVNMFIPHLFHYDFDTPITKTDYPASWFYRNPYWKYFKPLADYSKRISYMVSQGDHVCKVAMLYPLTSKWADGHTLKYEDKMYDELQGLLLKNYYDYDLIDPGSLKKSTATTQGLQIENESYQVLILPNLKAVHTASAKKIKEFAEKGGLVLAVGGIPSYSPEGVEESREAHEAMRDLFQTDPSKIYSRMYNMDVDKKHYYHSREYESGGKAIFTQYLWETASILNKYVGPDIEVESSTEPGLKFNHRKLGDTDFYLLLNDAKLEGEFKVAVEGSGVPELWNPEDGSVQKVQNYTFKNDRTELVLNLKPLEATFVVLQPDSKNERPLPGLVSNTDLEISSIEKTDKGIKVNGWAKSGNHSMTYSENGNKIVKTWTSTNTQNEITLDGEWNFLLSQHDLDYKWTDEISESEIELPVMQFQWTAQSLNTPEQLSTESWKRVKVKEEYTEMTATERIVSSWDASWISYIDGSKKLTLPEVWYRKIFELDEDIKDAILYITAETSYELFVNDKKTGSNNDWKTVESFDLKSELKKGKNSIEVHVLNSKGLLAQLDIESASTKKQIIKTDESWESSIDGLYFQPALVLASPPLGKWGNIQKPDATVKYPLQLWLSATVPTGAKSIVKPNIKGDYNIFINGKKLEKSLKKGQINIESYLQTGQNEIVLSVLVDNRNEGLLTPLKFSCGCVPQNLTSWADKGLWWYSGRGVYKKEVTISAEYFDKNVKMVLDLGEVGHFAEIWVNGKMVKYFPWGPFNANVTEYLKEGHNQIPII